MANEKRLIDANDLPRHIIEINDTNTGMHRIQVYLAETILSAPTVDAVEVVHGRWILQKDGYHCSNCDIQAIYTGVELKYCPNCGAKMDLEK